MALCSGTGGGAGLQDQPRLYNGCRSLKIFLRSPRNVNALFEVNKTLVDIHAVKLSLSDSAFIQCGFYNWKSAVEDF